MKRTILLSFVSIVLIAAILLGVSFALKGITEANAQAEHLKLLQTRILLLLWYLEQTTSMLQVQ